MRSLLLPLSVLSALSLSQAGCSRFGPRSNDAECQKACAKVTQFETEALRKVQFVQVHETEEHLEKAEDDFKDRSKELDEQEKAGPLKLDDAMLAKLPAARRASVLAAHKLREEQIVAQRKLARVRTQQTFTEAEETLAKLKAQIGREMGKALADSKEKCIPICLAGTLSHAQCLQRTQGLEDVALCKR